MSHSTMQTHHGTHIYNEIQLEHQLNIERTLLGMIIRGKEPKKGHIMEHIGRDMFIGNTNIEMFDMIQDQYKKHGIGRLNADCLINDYKGKQFKNGVFEALLELNYEFITDVNCDFYIRRLQESWESRTAESCTSFDDFKELENKKKQFMLDDKKNISFINDTECLFKMADDYECMEQAKLIRTGYRAIDDNLGSLKGGDLFILAGATGMGKTCMMLNIVTSMAKMGKKILIFSLEMNKEQLINRIVSAETNIDSSKYRNKEMTNSEEAKYWEYIFSEEFNSLNIKICTEYSITIEKIRSIVLDYQADVVFIDYLGLISGGNKQSSYERVSEISRNLKLLAMESNKPFIVLHQLNRSTEERKDKRPKLSDLRDSGKIEQDADIIGFVYRPSYYDNCANKGEICLMIAKNRHGTSGVDCNLRFIPVTQKILDREYRKCR